MIHINKQHYFVRPLAKNRRMGNTSIIIFLIYSALYMHTGDRSKRLCYQSTATDTSSMRFCYQSTTTDISSMRLCYQSTTADVWSVILCYQSTKMDASYVYASLLIVHHNGCLSQESFIKAPQLPLDLQDCVIRAPQRRM